jgi:hypothetical protein
MESAECQTSADEPRPPSPDVSGLGFIADYSKSPEEIWNNIVYQCSPREAHILATLNSTFAWYTGMSAIRNEVASSTNDNLRFILDDTHFKIFDTVQLFSLFTFTREFTTCKKITIYFEGSEENLDLLIDILQDLRLQNDTHVFNSFHLEGLPYVEEQIFQHLTSLIPAIHLSFDDNPLEISPAEAPNRSRYLPSPTICSLRLYLGPESSPNQKHFFSWFTTNSPNLEELSVTREYKAGPLEFKALLTLCYFCTPNLLKLHLDLLTVNPSYFGHFLRTTPNLTSLTISGRYGQWSEDGVGMYLEVLELPELVQISANILMHLILAEELHIRAGKVTELSVQSTNGYTQGQTSSDLFDAFFGKCDDHYPNVQVLCFTLDKYLNDDVFPFGTWRWKS